MLAVPEFASEIGVDALPPTRTLPKLTLAGLAESTPCVPAPLSAITVGELCALLATETLPDAVPTTVGENCTIKLLDCPGARVTGTLKPLAVNPDPVTATWEMFRLTVPVLASVTF